MRILALLLLGSPAFGFTPEFPGPSTVTLSQAEAYDSFAQPTAPWTEAAFPTHTVEGQITRTAWRIEPPVGFSTLSILAPMREALRSEGWQIVMECETDVCGGYDFRYRLDLFPEPEMHVDLGDFRYLSAQKDGERIGLMVSRTASLGFVQMVRAVPGRPPETQDAAVPPAPQDLTDLAFDSGGATLTDVPPALVELGEWLAADAARRVTLVGHTDGSGVPADNLALSQRRADAVRDWLIAQGVDPARVEARGVGAERPLDTNDTPEGRARNRRVEVIRD